jgi:uncharacterized protein
VTSTPIVDGWFTTGQRPTLLGRRCVECNSVSFPPLRSLCPRPSCSSSDLQPAELSTRGVVWSYTDAQYQPPAPYVADGGVHEPFAIAAVELPEGLVVLGQVARGYGVDDLRVGSRVELVVERLHDDESGERTIWRWKPIAEEVR